jgi:uracil-DNA glycosylase
MPIGMAPSSAAEFVPDTDDLTALSDASQACRGCDLYRNATQTVFGAGLADARVVLVGEQPGDQEDKAGQPFVGRQADCWTRRSSPQASTANTCT